MAASLILRTVKGTPLTNLEVDNNFSNLNAFGDVVSSNVGVLSALTTTITSNIVAAVNSIKSGNLSQFGTTTSSDLAGIISNETGSGSLVFGTGPTISLPVINNIKTGYTATATAGGTTTLDVNSNYQQVFTGSSNQTVQLPVVSTLVLGMSYHIENNGSGTLTITSSGGNTVTTVGPFQTVMVTNNAITGTDNTVWDWDLHAFGGSTGTGNVVLSVSPTFATGTVTANNITLTNVITTKKIVETVVAIGNTGTAASIDLSAGTLFTATLNGNATLTITNSGAVSSFTLILTNDGTAGRSVAFAGGSFKYPGGAASLSRTTAANAVDVWFFMTPDSGTTWYGSQPMKNLTA
jgi:hypothetical protein